MPLLPMHGAVPVAAATVVGLAAVRGVVISMMVVTETPTESQSAPAANAAALGAAVTSATLAMGPGPEIAIARRVRVRVVEPGLLHVPVPVVARKTTAG